MLSLNLKTKLVVLFAYVNPASIYWYMAVYKDNFELAFALLASLVFSLLVISIVKKYFYQRVFVFIPLVLAFSFLGSISFLILSQAIFAYRVMGVEELGFDVFVTYFGLSLFMPIFWINTVILIGIWQYFKSVGLIDKASF